MPFQDANYGTIGLAGIERVEIFEGPSAALQGGGNLGGTINYVTRQPLDTPRYQIDLGTGFEKRFNRPLGTLGFDATGPIDDELSYRVIGRGEYRERFQEPALKDDTRGYIGGSLRYRPDNDTTITGEVNYFHGNLYGSVDGVPARGTVLPNPGGFTIPYGRTYANAQNSMQPVNLFRTQVQVDRRLSDVWSINAGAGYNYFDFTYRDTILTGALAANGRTLGRSGVNIEFVNRELVGRINATGDFRIAGLPARCRL